MWVSIENALPQKDGDYLVVIKDAEIPTVLSYLKECECFYDEDHGC